MGAIAETADNAPQQAQSKGRGIWGSSGGSASSTYLMVPILIFFALLIFAVIRGPNLISSAGIGSVVIVIAPLVLATYSLTIIVMAGRGSVDLSIGPLIGFINVSMIQLFAVEFMDSPIAFFLFAMAVGVAYQVLQALIIIFVRVQPIIVSLAGYLMLVGLNLIIMPRPGGVAPDWMFPWGSGTEIWNAMLVILILATIGWYLITRTAFFGHLKLMGSDERAAYTSGVHIYWVRIGAHAIGGIYAGLSAIAFTSLISSGDPSQGTTYTLMAVTALVLGGANLAGGRGSAFGALLGSLNIYLITYVLSTFNFGMVQSFVTDLAYGVMLVVSLLISVAVPYLQKHVRNLSPLVFFVILAVIALGVIMHTSMDQPTDLVTSGQLSTFVVLDDGGVAKADAGDTGWAYSPGTYVLFIIIGVVGVVYAFRILFKHPSTPMVSFLVVAAIVGLGLIFAPDRPLPEEAMAEETMTEETESTAMNASNEGEISDEDPEQEEEISSVSSTYSPTMFAMENLAPEPVEQDVNDIIVSHTTTAVITVSGIVLLTSLIVLVMLPTVTIRTKRIAMLLFGTAVAVVAIGALFLDSFEIGYLASNFSGEIYAVILVGVGLFTLTAPLVHTSFKNISNVFIVVIGVLTFICVYFFTAPNNDSMSDVENGQSTVYAESIFKPAKPEAAHSTGAFAEPARVNVGEPGISAFTKLAYSLILVVLLHIFLYIAMEERTFRSFWRYWYAPVFSALLWGGLFYSVGVPLWQIVAVIAVAVLTGPNVLHIISTYLVKQRRDKPIEQWKDIENGFDSNELRRIVQ